MGPEVIIGLGSNQGDREANLKSGMERLARLSQIDKVSSIYETQAWGGGDQPDFLNMVCLISPNFDDPHELLKALKQIEVDLGRDLEDQPNSPRPLDLDILFWGAKVINSDDLIVPHPHIEQRRFVLEPLAEIAPDFRHPLLELTVKEMLAQCADEGKVLKMH
ncbi:2-amino-4-hydroxy-6-hydroxymethyldihydropteridine diphosphokinase [candidate division LCP-89 bacterium B3_LCP]|uniref:2-amino-4-hydroxy-6-hydroxymethyldihydropteridine pyrophosphokinase n=1 Tax=candidate division LCP-89 bacterium B3_LCP TaxID=2012998 RepID=A0A532V1Q8_UNCL8|nr:MAG: 2-amino-4-hydroxy-6-hydroxymethyldihydropteridine diphosphokinase [candidate division LCP-89 bacterium B3_LCP]